MAASARYTRYILFAFIAILLLVFVSSSGNKVPTVDKFQKGAANLINGQNALWNKYTPGQSPADAAPPNEIANGQGSSGSAAFEPVVSVAAGVVGSVSGSGSGSSDHNAADAKSNSSPNPYAGSSSSQTSFTNKLSTGPKMNATFVTLARNSDIWEIARSIRQVEDRFNSKYGYDWVFLNDAEFDDTFKKVTTSLTSGHARYGKISSDHWGFPEWIDQEKAKKTREDMAARKIIYGDSISYRHMCRYESGFFFRHPLLHEYEWYWRVEPSIELFCDIDYDPFEFMATNNKKYSFVLSLFEYQETIETLWESTKKWIRANPEHIAKDNLMPWLSSDGGETYTNCHFWSNFEIGNLDWLRSDAYVSYFTSLDRDGGFFYERWGDAPIHSIAAGLMLNKSEVHFFNDIAYYHVPFTHCPTGEDLRTKLKCHCNPQENFDWNGYSCTARYYDVMKMEKPAGYEKEQ